MNIFSSMGKGFGIAAVAGLTFISCNSSVTSSYAGDWQNEVTIYGWLSDISGNVKNGTEFTYDINDIVDSMEMVLMGGYEGRINRWSIIADMVYLDVGDKEDITVPAGTATVDVNLSSWVVSGAVGYDIVQSDDVRFSVVAGVRYIDMELESDLTVGGTEVPRASGSQDMLDGTIGVRGYLGFGDNWFLPYYADVGTGGSDISYQLFGGIGYQFGWGDVRLGYRHLCVEMEDEKLMEDLTISGPVLGMGFRF
jgi:hypothetical protein